MLNGCPHPRRWQPPGPDQRIKIIENPGFLPVQARGVRIHLAGGCLHKPSPPVGAQNTCGQARAESARCGPGLDHDRAAGALDLGPHRLRHIRPIDPGSFGWGSGHAASVALPRTAGQTICAAGGSGSSVVRDCMAGESLSPAARTEGGRRLYSAACVAQLELRTRPRAWRADQRLAADGSTARRSHRRSPWSGVPRPRPQR
jgi:hypothetical protein